MQQRAGKQNAYSNFWENYLKNLDSTDGLAAAVCHFSIQERSVGAKSYTGWDAFVKQNEERVRNSFQSQQM
jgi:hypothetical protein